MPQSYRYRPLQTPPAQAQSPFQQAIADTKVNIAINPEHSWFAAQYPKRMGSRGCRQDAQNQTWGMADTKNKANTDSSDGKLGGLKQAEVWWFPFRELTTHGTPDGKKGAGKATFSESNTEI
jgi:hypothetical protein